MSHRKNGLYTAKQAAEALDISRATFYRWKKAGKLKKLKKVGTRYRPTDILKILIK